MSAVAAATPRAAARRRALFWVLAGAIVAGLVYLMATASTGPVDPTEVAHPQSRATIVFNSGMIVFREGLEAVLIFAAVTASFRGANRARRRPVVLGAACAFAAAVVTWFVVQAVLDAASASAPGWRRSPASWRSSCCWSCSTGSSTRSTGRGGSRATTASAAGCWRAPGSAPTLGLVALGFTSVYREGFEVVLFLQNLQLQDGSGTVLEGVAIGLAATAVVGVLTFWLHAQAAVPADADPHRRPGRRRARGDDRRHRAELRRARLAAAPRHALQRAAVAGRWFEIYPSGRRWPPRSLAAAFVVGSYYAAEYVKVKRPRKQGRPVTAVRATAAPAEQL